MNSLLLSAGITLLWCSRGLKPCIVFNVKQFLVPATEQIPPAICAIGFVLDPAAYPALRELLLASPARVQAVGPVLAPGWPRIGPGLA